MKLSFPVMMILFAGCAWAQPGRWFDALAQVKQFLQLSDSQLQTILTNNDEYNRWSFEKQARIRQVQSEIADETARQPLEPSALGIRYAEVESICREMKDRANSYRSRNLDVLSQDQKVKMRVLEDAMKLVPVIAEAQSGNLIGGLNSAPFAFTSTSTGIGGSILGGIIGPANGCYFPFPAGAVRTGDFTATLPKPANSPSTLQMESNRAVNPWFDTTTFRK